VTRGQPVSPAGLNEGAASAVRDAGKGTKSELLEIALHELRSPLTVIQGYSSLLAAGELGSLEEPALKAIRIIATKASEAQELATTLLTVARLESNELRIERRTLPLRHLLDSVRDRAAPRLHLARAGMTVDCPRELGVVGDASLVAGILDNLINNAVIYSDPPVVISLTASLAGGQVELRVSDRGPGVAEADRSRIFDRFARGAGSERVAGTGLGLYVSRECARRMGGDLTLETSGPGAGSTFLLRLPAG